MMVKKYKPVKGKLIKIVDDNHILLRYYDGEEVLYNLNHVNYSNKKGCWHDFIGGGYNENKKRVYFI